MVTFHGERVRGRYVLFRTRGDDWMIHRMDPPRGSGPRADARVDGADAGPLGHAAQAAGRPLGVRDQVGRRARRSAFVERRARPAEQPQRARHHRRAIRSCGRSGEALGAREALLDGEVVAFERRAPELPAPAEPHAPDLRGARCGAWPSAEPVVYVIFDLLYLDGRSLIARPYEERRAELLELGLSGPDVAGARPPRRRRRGDARGLARAGARGHRGQAARLPVRARAARARLGEGQERAPRPTSSSAAGCRARAGARRRSARWRSASTTTRASCATPARSAAASPTPS